MISSFEKYFLVITSLIYIYTPGVDHKYGDFPLDKL